MSSLEARNDIEALRDLSRSVIKEELRNLQAAQTTTTLSVVGVLRDELRHLIGEPEREPQPTPCIPTYSEVLSQPLAHSYAAVAKVAPWPPIARSVPHPLEPTACVSIAEKRVTCIGSTLTDRLDYGAVPGMHRTLEMVNDQQRLKNSYLHTRAHSLLASISQGHRHSCATNRPAHVHLQDCQDVVPHDHPEN
ncbi:hypothetical protein HPB52_021428 [Rhipicephalus sanguineus]|uniref:Uncharacterized protein n=1 Tax=Rhipicephalus sanguineus TaxID=34632 RepID=A0A9D4PFF4_RHISA|nr:hypothetical protein HPB52_021428 [Rhipicephalus sanguineus]